MFRLLALILATPSLAVGQVATTKAKPVDAKAATGHRVVRVVDGDTIVVEIEGKPTTVRLIGVDTPETVHPSKPVERFGKEASAFLRSSLAGRTVRLEYEPGPSRLDRYGRTLAYVYTMPDGRLVNREIIARGFGHAYTRFPFGKAESFRKAEAEARRAGVGLWKPAEAGPSPTEAKDSPGPATTVYVTDTGKKYHSEGCRYLAKSSIPLALDQLPPGIIACSKCSPPVANIGR